MYIPDELPKTLLKEIITAYSELHNHLLEQENVFPNEVYIEQGKDISFYMNYLQQTIFNDDEISHDSTEYLWQIRQCFRIINTALSSEHLSINVLKETFIKYQKDLESLLKPFLDHINDGSIEADIVCTGHAGWFDYEGYITFLSPKSSVVIYGGLGGKISNTLSKDIENNSYNEDNVVIQHIETKEETSSHGFIREYNQKSSDLLPNYGIQGKKDLKFRLIEMKTGRILKESASRKVYFLGDLLKEYPNRRIHFASCLSQYHDKRKNRIGPYANCKWKKKVDVSTQSEEDNQHNHDLIESQQAANDLLFFQHYNRFGLLSTLSAVCQNEQHSSHDDHYQIKA